MRRRNNVSLITAVLLMVFVTISPSINVVSTIIDPVKDNIFTYNVIGEYTGTLEVDLSGRYKALLTGNTSDLSHGFLRINYRFSFFLYMVFSKETRKFIYGYTLENYTLTYIGFSKNFIEKLNKTLFLELNKTYISHSIIVNPRILLEVSPGFTRIYFNDFTSYRNISAISLYEDVVCFEYDFYHEKVLDTSIYKTLIVTYYDTITLTPLYIYKYRILADLYNDTNYIVVKETITDYGIGSALSRIMYSNSKIIYFSNGLTGKIGVVLLGKYEKPIITWRNNTLTLEVHTRYPYRLILTLDKNVKVNSSTIRFKTYYLRTVDIYVSDVITHNSTYNISFNKVIKDLVDQGGNATFVHEITIEEKSYSSNLIIFYTLIVNLALIFITYRISKIIAFIIKHAF